MMRSTTALMRLTFRNLFAGKRAWAAGLLLLLPPVVAALMTIGAPQAADPTRVFQGIAFAYSLHLMIFLLALVFGIALTSGEIEEGTVGYLYLGAVPKWLIVLVQIGVAAVALTALAFLSLFLTAAAAGLSPKGPLPEFWRSVGMSAIIAGAGFLAALSFYATCGLTFKHPLAIAVTATFFWELMVTLLPVKFAAWTVTNNLRVLMLHLVFDGEGGDRFKYVKNYALPGYDAAAMFLSIVIAAFMVTAMLAAMNRSIEGKESR